MSPRAITDRDNKYAERNRRNKAEALANAIQANYPGLSLEVVDRLPSQSDEWWRSLAQTCNVNPPSAATIVVVCDFLRKRLNAAVDPFEGLGQVRDAGGTWGR